MATFKHRLLDQRLKVCLILYTFLDPKRISAKAPGCSAGALSKVGPVFCALPRSKLVRFRFSGLGWVCVLCPSQVRAAQVTRYLMNALSRWAVCLNHLSSPGHLVSQVC